MCERSAQRRRRPSVREGRGARPQGEGPDPPAAARGPGALHRLRHLRGQMPGPRQAGDLCIKRGESRSKENQLLLSERQDDERYRNS